MNLTEFPLGSKVPFADTAAIYRDAGLFPVPCEDKAAKEQNASRTTVLDTRSSLENSVSLGSRSPGLNSCVRMCWVSAPIVVDTRLTFAGLISALPMDLSSSAKDLV